MLMPLYSKPAAVAAALILLTLPAFGEGPYVSLELGQGQIDIDETDRLPFTPTGATDGNVAAFAVGGGYLFPSGAYVDIAFTDLDTVSLFGIPDVFELSSLKIGAGYTIEAGEKLNFLAKIGVAFWELDARESAFLNPGPELEQDFDGTDLFFELGGEYVFGERFRLSLVHARETNDLGDASATRLGVKYYFGNR